MEATRAYREHGLGELKAIGKVRRDGVEVAGHSKLMTFGAFELHAKSALRRATGNMYTIKGRILQASSGIDVFHIVRLRQGVTLTTPVAILCIPQQSLLSTCSVRAASRR